MTLSHPCSTLKQTHPKRSGPTIGPSIVGWSPVEIDVRGVLFLQKVSAVVGGPHYKMLRTR
jgi:hypothetical protein